MKIKSACGWGRMPRSSKARRPCKAYRIEAAPHPPPSRAGRPARILLDARGRERKRSNTHADSERTDQHTLTQPLSKEHDVLVRCSWGKHLVSRADKRRELLLFKAQMFPTDAPAPFGECRGSCERRLSFDITGGQKAQLFDCPVDGCVMRPLQELELLQPTSEKGKATTYAWRRFALEIRRDSHNR